MKSRAADFVRLKHILEAIQDIESYIIGHDFDVFMSNSMMRFASIKQMEIIGEAANHITDETKNEFSDVEWAQIIGLRNILVHEYFGVDTRLVWEIIKNDIPGLKVKIQNIVDNSN